MKVIWSIVIVSIVFSAAAFYVIYTGKVEVSPLRILNPTNFSDPKQVGALVFRRFWAELNREKLVVVASSPYLKEYDEIWRGFLAVANERGVRYARLFEQEGLRSLAGRGDILDLTAEPLDWSEVQLALAGETKVLVHIVATDEMWRQVKERTLGGFVIFQSLLPVTEASKKILHDDCERIDGAWLSCLAERALSHGKKKKFEASEIATTIERHGPREYVLFVHEGSDQ